MVSEQPKTGNVNIIDRLTICLKKRKKNEDIISEVERYINEFPDSKKMKSKEKVLKRAKLL